jgi:hypothetical protein
MDAQLGERVHSIVIEHVLEHGVAYRGEPVWEKRGEGETSTERQSPCISGWEPSCHHGDDNLEMSL